MQAQSIKLPTIEDDFQALKSTHIPLSEGSLSYVLHLKLIIILYVNCN